MIVASVTTSVAVPNPPLTSTTSYPCHYAAGKQRHSRHHSASSSVGSSNSAFGDSIASSFSSADAQNPFSFCVESPARQDVLLGSADEAMLIHDTNVNYGSWSHGWDQNADTMMI
jgi:hypothetical protein